MKTLKNLWAAFDELALAARSLALSLTLWARHINTGLLGDGGATEGLEAPLADTGDPAAPANAARPKAKARA